MTFYLGLVVMLSLLAVIFGPQRSLLGKRTYSIVAFGTLALVSAFRAPTVGVDTRQYYDAFSIIGSIDWADRQRLRYESGYTLINQLVYKISDDPQFLIGVTSIFIIASAGWFFFTYSPNILLSIVLFVFLLSYANSMTALRQWLALAIVLLFVPQLLKGRYFRFILGVALAMQFHTTAAILLVLIPFSLFKLSRASVALTIFASIALVALSEEILSRVYSQEQYANYDNLAETGKFGVLLTLLANLVVVAAVTVTYRTRGNAGGEGASSVIPFFLYASWAVIPVLALGYTSTTYFRLAIYFIPFIAVGAPVVLQTVENPGRRYLATSIIVLISLVYFVAVLSQRPEWYGVTPYESVLS